MPGTTLYPAWPHWDSAADPTALVDASVRWLRLAGAAATAFLAGATALAVVLRWPGQFAGPGAGQHILLEALVRGTAVSPPVPVVLGLACAVWLGCRRHTGWIVGCAAVVLVSMVVVVNGLAVAMAPITHGVPRAALVLAGAVSAVLAGVTIVAAVQRSLVVGN
jgi:hypothetical protein